MKKIIEDGPPTALKKVLKITCCLSFERRIKTVVKEFKKLSKLFSGDSPCGLTSFVLFSNLAFSAKSSSPKSVKTKIKRKRNTEKEVISFNVFPRVSKSSSNLFHFFASLKILKSLNPLKAVTTEPLSF